MDELIGPGEAGRELGVSTRTVQRWLRSGQLPAVGVGGRLKVRRSDVTRGEDPVLSPLSSSASSAPPGRPIRRLLVANRGELVVRIARTCHALGVTSLALATVDQQEAWWTRAADEIVPLADSYLDGPAIVAAALAASADAIHPGYGFLAERADFAEAVVAAGMTWVGPPPDAMRALGDKAAARRLAVAVGVPILPGYDGPEQSDVVLRREAKRVGFPVLLKPSAGGGGKGMHVVRTATDLGSTLAVARREALAAFGDDRLVLERYLDRPRHVEVQLLIDARGTGVHLGERDCSLQRRHQKVVEEAPAPGVGRGLRDRLGRAALDLARAAGYVGAGTAEFLLADDGTFVFLEMNARLQVEHPVTEAITGLDLVASQLRIARGEPLGLRQSDVRLDGHAFEARLYAEDPWNGFLPAVGRIGSVNWPTGPGLRVDAGVGDGDEVGVKYDPLLAKIVAHGADRRTALSRVRAALRATRTIGVTTNRGFLEALLGWPDVNDGDARTDTIETRWHPKPGVPDAVWVAAAVALDGRHPGGFRLNGPRHLAIAIDGEQRTVPVAAADPADPDATHGPAGQHGATRRPADWAWELDGRLVLDVDGRAVHASLGAPPNVDDAVRGARHSKNTAAPITAPMPGVVLAIHVRPGQAVEAHDVLIVLEAMKMENAIRAPSDGVVERVVVRQGQAVQRGDVLVELEG